MSKNAYKRYEKVNYYKGGSVATKIMSAETDRKNALKCNEDTIIRTEIHAIISLRLKEGKNQEDIMNELCRNQRFKKYNMYFENWITDKIKKVVNQKEKLESQEQEK